MSDDSFMERHKGKLKWASLLFGVTSLILNAVVLAEDADNFLEIASYKVKTGNSSSLVSFDVNGNPEVKKDDVWWIRDCSIPNNTAAALYDGTGSVNLASNYEVVYGNQTCEAVSDHEKGGAGLRSWVIAMACVAGSCLLCVELVDPYKGWGLDVNDNRCHRLFYMLMKFCATGFSVIPLVTSKCDCIAATQVSYVISAIALGGMVLSASWAYCKRCMCYCCYKCRDSCCNCGPCKKDKEKGCCDKCGDFLWKLVFAGFLMYIVVMKVWGWSQLSLDDFKFSGFSVTFSLAAVANALYVALSWFLRVAPAVATSV